MWHCYGWWRCKRGVGEEMSTATGLGWRLVGGQVDTQFTPLVHPRPMMNESSRKEEREREESKRNRMLASARVSKVGHSSSHRTVLVFVCCQSASLHHRIFPYPYFSYKNPRISTFRSGSLQTKRSSFLPPVSTARVFQTLVQIPLVTRADLCVRAGDFDFVGP